MHCFVSVSEGLHDMEQTATVMSDYALRFLTAAFAASVMRLDLNNQGLVILLYTTMSMFRSSD
jgi:aromatic ring-cleaving dioxygenase